MANKRFSDKVTTYECSICGEEVSANELACSTRREAKSTGRSVGSLNHERIICYECEMEEDDLDTGDLFDGSSEVWQWNLSGITVTPAQRTVLALNF